jgi:cell wall-associated NlpC family hydrolase
MSHLLARAAAATAGLTLAGLTALTGGLTAAAPITAVPAAAATRGIPATFLRLYRQDAARCPGLGWPVLAGIGKVESDHGRAPSLVSSAGAEGPMQFEPATWTTYGVDADRNGTTDPFDPADAIAAAADYLCSLGAARDLRDALIAYNCGNADPACQATSAGYAALVLHWARTYAISPTGEAGAAGPVGTLAVQAALSQLGVPYLWGGESTAGFDCSGLAQWAFARAGVPLPRTAQDQYDAGPVLPPGTAPAAGDLVFFGAGTAAVDHVGISLGDGRMVDAPHTGAVVRIDPITGFTPGYVGATDPAGSS